MDTKPLEKFCPWARVKLLDAIHARCVLNGLDDAGRAAAGLGAEVIGTHVLKPYERQQRDNLFKRIEAVGYNAFVDEEAYTWFNRFMGIRYMEVHGYLPSGIRVLSDTDGSFDPACLRAAGELDLPGLDRDQAIDLAIAGNRTELFRLILIAQCNQLADALPSVFDHVDDADALVLPDGLLNKDENSVLYHLVEDIPEETWQDVEIMGWMYQFYNAELKAEFFKSKRKAAPEDLAPATQLFTPEWIVRYMVDNSLGRLWMLNHPDSRLIERAQAENPAGRLMEYYIAPDEGHEDFIRIANPEDITFCDPACGSGHILVYAFKMLMAIYEECGYRTRDIPELILTKNLSGMEIDPRAAQIATLALAMCAREHDRRFFTRDVVANIQVLHDVAIDADSLVLTSPLRQKPELLDTLAHLGEIGSLFAPTDDDIAALEGDLHESPVGDLFSARASENVDTALSLCKALQRRFDVVVANPPYMGSSSFNPFMSKWMKKHYPDSCKDLCTAFIERGYTLARDSGYAAMVTMQSWMFLGSFEKMRQSIIDEKTILTMAHLGPRAFDAIGGEVVSVTADVLYNGNAPIRGAYARLVDINGSEPKREKLLEAIYDPACGWFYRADATTFHDIPGSPIAYWASSGLRRAFKGNKIRDVAFAGIGMRTGNNERFLRRWFEVNRSSTLFNCSSRVEQVESHTRWVPYNKGGIFRRWYGNNEYVVNWWNDGYEIKENTRKTYPQLGDNLAWKISNENYYYKPGATWTGVTSGMFNCRLYGRGFIFDSGANGLFSLKNQPIQFFAALLNSSVISEAMAFLNPTLNFGSGTINNVPVPECDSKTIDCVSKIADSLVSLSKLDWDSQETSWDFKRNPLV